ncbi:MAG: hypothetical protein ABL982_12970 [Vicinamibacterales bacterium]
MNGVLPPDPTGAIGPNHFVQAVNLSFAIYDRAGARLYGPAGTHGNHRHEAVARPAVVWTPVADAREGGRSAATRNRESAPRRSGAGW